MKIHCGCCLSFFLIFCTLLSKTIGSSKKNDDDKDVQFGNQKYSVFEPTSEWKPLRKDEAIPRGTHVRLNLGTGEREAKLAEPEETEGQIAVVDTGSTAADPDDGSELTLDSVRAYLRNLPVDDPTGDPNNIKKKFRTYDELKEELAKVEKAVKTDAELLHDLLEAYKEAQGESVTQAALLPLLKDMELLVHQIDNARLFVKNGLKEVAYPCLNASSPEIRYEATRLLGAAVQNNPPAQVLAVESDAISHLLRTISIDHSVQVKIGATFALSCLLRRFPAAQKLFLQRGGLAALEDQFNYRQPTTQHIKLQMKILSLISDLLEEKTDAEDVVKENIIIGRKDENSKERERQYIAVDLLGTLDEEVWCGILSTVTTSSGTDDALPAVAALAKKCAPKWAPISNEILAWVKSLIDLDSSSDDTYDQERDSKRHKMLATIIAAMKPLREEL